MRPDRTTAFVVALGRDTFDLDAAQHVVDAAWTALAGRGITLIGEPTIASDDSAVPDRVRGADIIVVLQATFTDAQRTIAIAEASDLPIVVWSFPEPRTGARLRLNSFCGANLAAFSLRRRGRHVVFLHADPGRCDIAGRLDAAVETARSAPPTRVVISAEPGIAAPDRDPAGASALSSAADRIAGEMATALVGIVGERPTGFEPCEVDDDALIRTIGTRLDRVGLDDLFSAADRADAADVRDIAVRVTRTMTVPESVATQGLDESLRLYCGLRSITDRRGWSAVATRCWPECMTIYGGALCAPDAMLTEDGVPAVCEADALGAVTALLLRLAADSDPFVVDLVDIDHNDDTSVVWHCGSASPTWADDPTQRTGIVHQNRHRALVNQFALRPGRVTIARLSRIGDRLTLVLAGGRMLDRPRPFAGTCGVLQWDLPAGDVVNDVFGFGVEHHLGIVGGEHRDLLVELARRWRMPVLRLGHTGSFDSSASDADGAP